MDDPADDNRMRQLTMDIDGRRIFVADSGGHAPFLSCPEEFNAPLLNAIDADDNAGN